ncbi:hypothetical protein GN956_G20001 [Arapaima gigas]
MTSLQPRTNGSARLGASLPFCSQSEAQSRILAPCLGALQSCDGLVRREGMPTWSRDKDGIAFSPAPRQLLHVAEEFVVHSCNSLPTGKRF